MNTRLVQFALRAFLGCDIAHGQHDTGFSGYGQEIARHAHVAVDGFGVVVGSVKHHRGFQPGEPFFRPERFADGRADRTVGA